MKKIITWIAIGLAAFVTLVGVIFVALTYISSDPEPEDIVEMPEKETVTEEAIVPEVSGLDSLVTVLGEVRSELLFTQLAADSLQQRIIFMDGLVIEYEKTIEGLNDIVLEKQIQRSRIKDLAKTYETMKPTEIQPILANVDDKTVIALYENMSSRTRKVILNSLNGERAGIITQQLAGITTEE